MWEHIKDYIPIEKCRDGYVYAIYARNSSIGIYNTLNKSFTVSRIKFGSNYLFDEYHWDTGAPFGTVKPYREMWQAPSFKNDDEKLKYLNDVLKSNPEIVQ